MKEIELQTTLPSPKVDPARRTGKSVDVKEPSSNNKSQQSEVVKKEVRDVANMVVQVNKFVKSLSTTVSFSVDDRSGTQIIIVSEKETGKIIRQIPPQEMLELAAKMEEISGIIFNGKV